MVVSGEIVGEPDAAENRLERAVCVILHLAQLVLCAPRSSLKSNPPGFSQLRQLLESEAETFFSYFKSVAELADVLPAVDEALNLVAWQCGDDFLGDHRVMLKVNVGIKVIVGSRRQKNALHSGAVATLGYLLGKSRRVLFVHANKHGARTAISQRPDVTSRWALKANVVGFE